MMMDLPDWGSWAMRLDISYRCDSEPVPGSAGRHGYADSAKKPSAPEPKPEPKKIGNEHIPSMIILPWCVVRRGSVVYVLPSLFPSI